MSSAYYSTNHKRRQTEVTVLSYRDGASVPRGSRAGGKGSSGGQRIHQEAQEFRTAETCSNPTREGQQSLRPPRKARALPQQHTLRPEREQAQGRAAARRESGDPSRVQAEGRVRPEQRRGGSPECHLPTARGSQQGHPLVLRIGGLRPQMGAGDTWSPRTPAWGGGTLRGQGAGQGTSQGALALSRGHREASRGDVRRTAGHSLQGPWEVA